MKETCTCVADLGPRGVGVAGKRTGLAGDCGRSLVISLPFPSWRWPCVPLGTPPTCTMWPTCLLFGTPGLTLPGVSQSRKPRRLGVSQLAHSLPLSTEIGSERSGGAKVSLFVGWGSRSVGVNEDA